VAFPGAQVDQPRSAGATNHQRVPFAAVQEIDARNHTVSQFLDAGFILLGIGFAETKSAKEKSATDKH
jgi:hypothetical protein